MTYAPIPLGWTKGWTIFEPVLFSARRAALSANKTLLAARVYVLASSGLAWPRKAIISSCEAPLSANRVAAGFPQAVRCAAFEARLSAPVAKRPGE